MPPLPPISQTLRLRLLGTINNQNWASIQYAGFSGGSPLAADLNTIASSVRTAWLNALAPLCETTCLLKTIEVIDLSSDTAAVGISTGTNTAGTRAGNGNPNNTCCVASYKINRRYRGGHPRTYWPAGVASDTVNGALWTTAFLALAQNGMSAWVGNINAITFSGQPLVHGCVSYYERDPANPGHSKLRTTPLFFKTQSVTVHGRVDTQRRRLGKEIV